MEHKCIKKDLSLSVEEIINGMHDWVRVLDRNDTVIYMNQAMTEGLGGCTVGLECFKALGKDEPCKNCTSRQAVFKGYPFEKEETIGERVFSVISSPVKNEYGEITAVVEVLRDITQVKKLQKKLLEQNKKLQDDLDIAKKLQCSLLPKELPDDKLNFSFIYKPCEDLGGDYLDIFKIDDDHTGVYIADVSGHGVSASMLTIFLRSSINKRTLSPARALEALYRDFNRHGFGNNLYITVFYAILNLKEKKMVYSNAGHNVSPIVFNNDRFELLRLPGIPISDWMESPNYTERQISLEKGDRLFFYTDGIIEMRNQQNEQFGEERLLDLLLNSDLEPSGTLNRIVESTCRFTATEAVYEVPDDITMALLEVK